MRAPVLALATVAALAAAPSARAEEMTLKTAAPALVGRIGFVPMVGGGVAGLTNTSDLLPGFIGFTTLGLELHGELPPYGLFLRGQYLSSGKDGRWTAPSFALGGSYRLFGDGVDHLAIVARAGLLYDRWHATNAGSGCTVALFLPTNCKALPPIVPKGTITATPTIESVTIDALGAVAGARLELPITAFYAAVDAEIATSVDVSAASPGAIISLRGALVFGFRDLRP